MQKTLKSCGSNCTFGNCGDRTRGCSTSLFCLNDKDTQTECPYLQPITKKIKQKTVDEFLEKTTVDPTDRR